MKNCNHCGLYLPDDAFNWRYRLLGIRHKTCRNCQQEYQKVWYEGHKPNHLANVRSRKMTVRQEARQLFLGIFPPIPLSNVANQIRLCSSSITYAVRIEK